MSEAEREIAEYLEDALSAMDKAKAFVSDMSYEQFAEDEKTVFAVVRAIEIVGEAVKHVPQDFRREFNEIPWRDMAGMRDVLIHEYCGIDLETVWKTVKEDMPGLKRTMRDVLERLERGLKP